MFQTLQSQFKDIPMIVFILSGLFLIMALVYAIRNYKDNKEKRNKLIAGAFLLGYIILMFCSTVIFRNPYPKEVTVNLIPFWNYQDILSGIDPLDKWEVIFNILLFVPIGYLLASITKESNKHRIAIVLSISILLSVSTECLQYILNRGLCETDDVIHNTFGALVGTLCVDFFKKPQKGIG